MDAVLIRLPASLLIVVANKNIYEHSKRRTARLQYELWRK